MPTYLNSGTTLIDAEGIRLEAGESKATYQWIGTLPSGVTKTSDSPYFDKVVSSAKLTSTTTVSVPVTLLSNYVIKVYVGIGECTVKTNAAGAVARQVGLYETYELTCLSRIVDNIIVTISSGTVYVTIEKI